MDEGEVRWMTYAEAAAALGVQEEAIKRRVQRGSWRRQPGNDGRARVAVPAALLGATSGVTSPATPGATEGATPVDLGALLAEMRQARAERDAAVAGEAEAKRRLAAVEGALAVAASYAPYSARDGIRRRLRKLLGMGQS